MNSKDSRTWKDWQRVLYVWRYHHGHSGLSLNLLAHICKRPAAHLLQEINDDLYANWGHCPVTKCIVFRWTPWAPSEARSWQIKIEHVLRRFPSTKVHSIYRGEPQKRINLGGVSLSELRQAARGRTKLPLKGGARNVWL